MADEQKPHHDEGYEIVLVAVFAVVFGITFWLLGNHDQEAFGLFNLVSGKVQTWVR
jgi:Na+/H+-dicarboxylate symporter